MGVCYTTGRRPMFNIGFSELAIICIVLIIAVGPERLPSMMKTFGRTMRTLRQASRDIRASTGIDELMREDFDIQPAPRRPFIAPPVDSPPPVSRDDDVSAAAEPEKTAAEPSRGAELAAGATPAHTDVPAVPVVPDPAAGTPEPEAGKRDG